MFHTESVYPSGLTSRMLGSGVLGLATWEWVLAALRAAIIRTNCAVY